MNKKELLDNKMWKTKKCRMNAEKRLISNANFLNIANVYYSIFISIISIISIVFDDIEYSLVSVILSVALTISISFASSLNYKERSEKMKQNYIEIGQLESRLNYIEDTEIEKIFEVEKNYNSLLNNVENHLEHDYYKFLYYNDSTQLNRKIRTLFYLHALFIWVFRAAILIAPIAILFAIRKYY